MNVAVIGASHKPDRYSYQAVMLLREKGHDVFPVHPKLRDIEGILVYPSIRDIPDEIHTVTLYVSSGVSDQIGNDILARNPQRIIFNPGAENPTLEQKARDAGVAPIRACTLVLLKTGQF